MDLTDIKIIKLLKQNSKLSLKELGQNVNLSTPSVSERINKLVDLNIINKYTIDINYSNLGFQIAALIELKIKNNLYNDFKNFIKTHENVEFCYRVSGESCFMFKVHFKSMHHVEEFIDSIQIYGHSKTQFILSEIF